jgi:hypothetical protein
LDNQIKVTLTPIAEVPNSSLMVWLQGFEKIKHLLQVARVASEKGVILHAFFVRVDEAFMLTSIVFDPSSSEEDAQLARNTLYLFLEELAQLHGVLTLYSVKPQTNGGESEFVRIYPRATPVSKLQAPSHATYVN